MTLAAIFSVCLLCSASTLAIVPSLMHSSGQIQSTGQQDPSAKPADPSATQSQGNVPDSQTPNAPTSAPPPSSPAAAQPQTSSGEKEPATPKHRPRKKKPASTSNCNIPANATSPTPGDPTTATGTAPGDPSPANGTSPSPSNGPVNCPPSKKVVRNGGTSEPSIQLVGGGSGEQASHQRVTAEQLLGLTEANLKKAAGRQLNASQQEMVSQIHQFMDQSKAAVAAGDLNRARNLALKAHLLSDELVKP